MSNQKDTSSYPSPLERFADRVGLNQWFLRRRPIQIDSPPDIIVSPCDATIRKISQIGPDGAIEEKTLLGRRRYLDLDTIFPIPETAERFRGGWYLNQYLSVLRLHYVIFPCGGVSGVPFRQPGRAWPIVLFRTADVRNERVVFTIETDFCFPVAVVMIGSWNVAGIRPMADPGTRAARGDFLGEFRIGSSVVTLFPPECVEILAAEGENSPLGHPVGRVLARKPD